MVRPKKHLGQHFLTDHNIARKIAGQLSYRYPVLEIGPGKGILTHYILEHPCSRFLLMEIDTEAVDFLKHVFPDLKESVVEADVLKSDLSSLFESDFSVIGNFPYNISSQIFFRILEYPHQVKEVVCMLQKEVAQRIASIPGTKEYGILSVLLQTFYTVEYLFQVNETVFFPRPKVKSAVIRLIRNDRKVLPVAETFFFHLVKTAFNQRRKTLRNALKSILPDNHTVPERFLEKRAEQLSVEDFIEIAAFSGTQL